MRADAPTRMRRVVATDRDRIGASRGGAFRRLSNRRRRREGRSGSGLDGGRRPGGSRRDRRAARRSREGARHRAMPAVPRRRADRAAAEGRRGLGTNGDADADVGHAHPGPGSDRARRVSRRALRSGRRAALTARRGFATTVEASEAVHDNRSKFPACVLRRLIGRCLSATLVASLGASALLAQHGHGSEGVGKAHMETSCAPAVQASVRSRPGSAP